MTPGVFQSTRKESSNLLATIEYWNQMHIDMHVEVTKWNCIWCRQKLKKLLLWCHEEIWNLWWKAKFPIDNLFDSVPKKVHDCITQLFEISLLKSRWGSRTDWLKSLPHLIIFKGAWIQYYTVDKNLIANPFQNRAACWNAADWLVILFSIGCFLFVLCAIGSQTGRQSEKVSEYLSWE